MYLIHKKPTNTQFIFTSIRMNSRQSVSFGALYSAQWL